MFTQPNKVRGALALCAAALAFFVLSFGQSSALSIRLPLSELSAASRVIAQGRVERIESAWTAGGEIESVVYLRLANAPRGGLAQGALIPVRVRGGTVDGLTMRSSEEAVFVAGEDVCLFLDGLTDGAYRVVAGSQGKYNVVGDRAVNPTWGWSLSLTEMNAGAREDVWPAEAALTADAASAAAAPDSYVFNNVKWFGPNPMEESYLINVNTGDAGGNGGASAFINAIVGGGSTWNNAGAAFKFTYGGASDVTTTGYDEKNVVHWENMGSSTTLAEATWWSYDKGAVDQIIEVDIRFNDYYTWDATGAPAGGEQDLQSVATHELGHWLSLGHDTASNCSGTSGPIMCAYYSAGTLKRNLNSNDIAGIRSIYGAASASTPTFTPIPTRTATPTRTMTPTRTPTPHPTLRPDQIKSRQYLPLVLKK